MGRFSTTVQIKNDADRMIFVNSFCDVMKSRGFLPCSEDEAAVSYMLAFSKGSWVTLASEDYKGNPQKAYEDSRQIAEAMKTSVFSVEVVDSDFATLTLNNGDCVTVGDGSCYGIEEPMRGHRKYWEPLIANGNTWEQFTEIVKLDNVFVEDTLCKLATVFGITSCYIDADFDEVLSKTDENKNITALHFTKVVANAKTMSLNATFVKVFGEALEPIGFKRIKSKYPYYVRVVNDEIIHAITLGKVPSRHNEFCIKCGVATVYRGSIDFSINPYGENWFDVIYGVFGALSFNDKLEQDAEEFSDVITFSYSENTLMSTLEYALKMTKKVVLPLLNNVTDIKACTEYYLFNNHFFSLLSLQDIYENNGFVLKYPKDNECEGLLWLILNDRNHYKQQCEQWAQCEIKKAKFFEEKTHTSQSNYLASIPQIVSDSLSFYDKVFSDKEWLTKAHEELKRRKSINTEKLISYGFNIK